MATEISGNGMYWKSGIDNSDFKKGEQEIVSGFQRIEKAAQKSGDVLDKSISSKLGANAAQNIAILERELAKYEKTLERVSGSTNLGGKGFDGLKSQIRALYSEIDRQQAVLSKGGGISSTVIGETEKVVVATTKGASGIQKVVSGAWGFLRQAAYIIPGLGIAGIMGLIIEGVAALIKELSKGGGALEEFRRKAENTKSALQDGGYKDAQKTIADLTVEVQAAKMGFISKEKTVKHYNETLGKTFGAVKTVGEVEAKMRANAPDFIKMMFAKAQAAAAFNAAMKNAELAQEEKAKEYSFWDKVKATRNQLDVGQKVIMLSSYAAGSYDLGNAFVNKAVADQREQNVKKQEQLAKKNLEDYQKRLLDGMKTAGDKGWDFFGKDFDEKKKKAKDLTQSIYNAKKAVSELNEEIKNSDKKFEIQFESNAESETDKINAYFDGLKKKVEDFNNNPKNKKLNIGITDAALKTIEDNRAKALGMAEYNRGTEKLKESFEEKKKLYADYEEFKAKVGEDAANKQYAELIAKHKTYLERLQAEEDSLANKGGLSALENARYKQIQEERLKAQAQQKADESKHLADLLAKYATYEQQKKALREQYEKDIAKLSPEQQAERKRQYDEDVANLEESEAKKITSVKKYADEAIYTTKLAVRQQLEILNAAYNQAGLTPETKAALKSRIDEVAKLLSLSDSELTSAQLDAEIEKKQAAINELAKSGKTGTEEFKRFNDELMRLKQERLNYLTARIDTFKALSSAVGQLGNALSSLGDSSPALASIGNALQDVSSSADLFISNWERLANGTLQSADKIQMAATFIVNALNNILQSVQQNKLKEAEALQNVIDFQRGYNLALIEEQKIRDEMANNVFYKDSMRTIRANLSKQISLVKEYSKAMKDLESGQVKVGTKKVRDWGAVASSAVSGAGAGFLIGGPWGAAIGGFAGIVAGMAKKRQVVDVYDNLLKKYPELIDAEGNLNDAMAKSLLSSNLLDAKTKETLQYVSNLAEEYKKAKAEIDEVVKSLIGDVGNNIMSELVNNFKNGGEDAGEAFRRGFAKSLEKLYEDIIYAAIFGKDLQKMQDRIEKGFETGDMGIMETAMYEFLDGYEKKAEAQQDMMKKLQDYAKSKGIDVWQADKSVQDKTTRNTLSGGIKAITQDQADILASTFKGVQLNTLQLVTINKSLEVLAFKNLDCAVQIATNTGLTVAELKILNSKIQSQTDITRAMGGLGNGL